MKIEQLMQELGKELILLTIHEQGACGQGVGIPELADSGMAYRSGVSYGFETGGSAYSGIHFPGYGLNTSYATKEFIKEKSITQSADFDLQVLNVSDDKLTATIKVTIKPKVDLPENVALHLFLYETKIDYITTYNFNPPTLSEQFMYNVVKQMPTGDDGVSIPALTAGSNHVEEVTIIRKAEFDNIENMRIAVLIQKMEKETVMGDEVTKAKEVLAVIDTDGSPFLNNMSIVPISNIENKSKIQLQLKKVGSNTYSFILPNNNTKIDIYNTSGRKIMSKSYSGKGSGYRASINIPNAKGIYFMRVYDSNKQLTNLKLPIN